MPGWDTCAKYLLECTRASGDDETLRYAAGDIIGVVDRRSGEHYEGRHAGCEGWVLWDGHTSIVRHGVLGACNKLSELVVTNTQRQSLKGTLLSMSQKVLVPLQGVLMRNHTTLGLLSTGVLEDLLLKVSLLISSVAKTKYVVKKKYLARSLKHYYRKLKHEVAHFAVAVATEVSAHDAVPSAPLVRSPTLPVDRVSSEPPQRAASVEVQTVSLPPRAESPCGVPDEEQGPSDVLAGCDALGAESSKSAGAWRAAADTGCAASMVELGKMCELGAEPSKQDAAVWYRYAAERGSAEGQYRLALVLLSYDNADKKVLHEAEQLLASAAACYEGHPAAAVHCGWLYESSLIPSRRPLSNAARWYKLAAACGSPEAYAHVGYCKIIKGHFLEAVDYLQVAVQHNEPEGMHAMGMMYLHSLGVPKDSKLARQLFTRAAELGHGGSLQQMGNYYYTSNKLPGAIAAYKKAALLGDCEACGNLAAICGPKEEEYWKRRAHKIQKSYHRWGTTVLEVLAK